LWKRWFVVVTLFFWVQVAHVPTTSAQEIVLEGILSLAHRGAVTGTEAFELSRFSQGFRLISWGRILSREGEVTWIARALYSPELYPLEYELEKRTPTTSTVIHGVYSDTMQGFSVELYRDGTFRGSTLLRSQNPVLLDEDVVSHYVVLALELWIHDGGGFTALVPQARAAVPLRAELEGLAAFPAPWGDEAAQRWRLTLAGEEVLIHEHAGELLWAEVPEAGLSAWRSDLFRSLPRPYRIQVEMSLPGGAREEGVRFASGKIAGTLLLPSGRGPLPAVLFLPGTGEIDRDGSAPGKPTAIFRELAYSLAEAGFASLRYDKRGVGESHGDLSRASFSDLRSDARAALRWLLSRPEVERVFLVGHSEGVLHALALAGEPGIAGLVLLGAPARPLGEVLVWQLESALRAAGASEEKFSDELQKLEKFLAFVQSSSGDWDDYTIEELRAALPDYPPDELEEIRKTSLRWWREALVFDPVAAVREVGVPFLAVNGGADIRVPPEDVSRLAEAAREAGNPDARGTVIPKMNHWLRFQPGRPLPERLTGPLDPRAVELLVSWMEMHFRR